MFPFGLIIVLLNLSLELVDGISQREAEKHLELGREFLAKGQLADALTHYHAAVDADPNNYLTYFKRGIIHVALDRPKLALPDFDKALELKPDFVSARGRRGSVLLKQGLFNDAYNEFNEILMVDPQNEEALNGLDLIHPTKEAISIARDLIDEHRYVEAVEYLSQVVETCPWSAELRTLRAECHEANGDFMNAVADYRALTKLRTDDTQGYHKLSERLYRLGHINEALTEIRNCLRLDPEHKGCFSFYKKIKDVANNLAKGREAEESKDYKKCVKHAEKILTFEKEIVNVQFEAHRLLCKCLPNVNDNAGAIKNCNMAVEQEPKDPTVLCDRAEAYLAAEMFDEAIHDTKAALEIDQHSARAKELLQTAQQRQKMAGSRDYYKILNVPRHATKREITKAYRKAAQQWHPDNYPDGEQKKQAEKKFIDIAAAKEVLTDDEKRQKFDRGEDPLSPESAKYQNFNPFQEFHQFHGSPFQFKFHFN